MYCIKQISLKVVDNLKCVLNREEIEKLCLEMIYQIGKRDRFSLLKEIYQNSNNVILLYDVLDDIKLKKHLPYNYNELILENGEITDLTEITKDKFDEISINSFVIENKLKEIVSIGTKLDLESKNESIIEDLISTSEGLLNLLNSFLPIKENSKFLLRNMEKLNEYKNIDEIKKLVDNNDSIKNEFIIKIFLEGYDKFNSQ